jgi:hypothetical protein
MGKIYEQKVCKKKDSNGYGCGGTVRKPEKKTSWTAEGKLGRWQASTTALGLASISTGTASSQTYQ